MQARQGKQSFFWCDLGSPFYMKQESMCPQNMFAYWLETTVDDD